MSFFRLDVGVVVVFSLELNRLGMKRTDEVLVVPPPSFGVRRWGHIENIYDHPGACAN